MKNSNKNQIQRNKWEAINHMVNVECLPAISALRRLQKKEDNWKKNFQKRGFIRNKLGDIPVLKRALVCLLCARVHSIFFDKQGISYEDFSGKKLQKSSIIKKMNKTRNTWFGHVGRDVDDIVTAKEICNSNLESTLKSI